MKAVFLHLPILCLLLASCSVQKRHYLKGYHVEWSSAKQNRGPQVHQDKQRPVTGESINDTKVLAESSDPVADAGQPIFQQHGTPPIFSPAQKRLAAEECDIIIMRNGDEIKAKVSEIGYDFIKYKRCDNPDGPQYTVQKSEVFMIKYPNGTKDIIEAPSAPKQAASPYEKPLKKPVYKPAIFALIIAVVGLFMPVELIGLFFAMEIAALVIGILSINKIVSTGAYRGKGWAIAAIIVAFVFGGLIALALSLS